MNFSASNSSLLGSPKFSIIVPTLNSGSTISSALQSLISQTYMNYEILILDSESTDNTLEVISEFSNVDQRIKCICEKDAGIYEAMNKGIGKSTGQWLFFMGSDDTLYDTEILADVVNAIQTNPSAKLIYGNVQLNEVLGYHHTDLVYAGKFDIEKLLKKNICHQSVFYHRSLFQQFGLFRTKYQIFADYDFNLRCFNKIISVYLDRIIANFNVGGRSKNQQQLDCLFEKDFIENLALYYGFSYKSNHFKGHKKELFYLLRRRFLRHRLRETFKIAKIISYQAVAGLAHHHK